MQLLDLIRTPNKLGRFVVAPSHKQGEFDSHAIDGPFLFAKDGRYWISYLGWDGVGYQTGLDSSTDHI